MAYLGDAYTYTLTRIWTSSQPNQLITVRFCHARKPISEMSLSLGLLLLLSRERFVVFFRLASSGATLVTFSSGTLAPGARNFGRVDECFIPPTKMTRLWTNTLKLCYG